MIDPSSEVDPVAAVVAALQGREGTRWIGVDGKGATGKTSLAARIAAALPGSVIVHIDDFARPDLRGWERARFVRQVLEPLLAGRPAHYQRWDFDRNAGAGWHTVPTGLPVVVEGVSSTDMRVGVPWDFTIWIEVPYEIRLARALERDGPEMMERWLTDWMPSEDAYEQEQRPQDRVDLVYRPPWAAA
ncbi:MAG: uridine kinase [Propionibacteriaceae bacterium]